MNILALDTSSSACSIAIAMGDKVYSHHIVSPMQQAQTILPILDELLNSIDAKLADIEVIAFGAGPGSFTGIRIAASVAQGLGYALNIPLVSVSSLALLAQAAFYDKGWQKLLVGVDARLEEVYWASYEVNQEGVVQLMGKESALAPERLTAKSPEEYYGVGNAWSIYRSRIPFQVIDIDSNRMPEASAMIELAKQKIALGELLRPEQALPVYLRDEVAVKSNKR